MTNSHVDHAFIGDYVHLLLMRDCVVIELVDPDVLESYVDHSAPPPDNPRWRNWTADPEVIWRDLIQQDLSELGWEVAAEADYVALGALTCAPILLYQPRRDDTGQLVNVERVFWFPNYMIHDPLAILLIDGRVTFAEAD